MKYLITGGCGFVGTNLASEVLRRGHELHLFDNLSRHGSQINLDWLRSLGATHFHHGDIRHAEDIENLIKKARPDVIFHLAGQVAMTTSLENPLLDFKTNALGSLHLLEAVRKYSPDSIILYSSSNKVYGELDTLHYQEEALRYSCPDYPLGLSEKMPIDLQSPYGCSKGTADQYMLDYARNFGVRTVVFRHSSIFGGRQFATIDQGWIGWFIQLALRQKTGQTSGPFQISGDGKQVRDILFCTDLIDCYFAASQHIDHTSGQAYNIGGGIENSISLLELFRFLERELSINITHHSNAWRANDQKFFVADNRKAMQHFHWQPRTDLTTGLRQMIDWINTTRSPS